MIKKMIRRFCDLDGTILFSYRYEIGEKVLVERYNGKELSYMPRGSYEFLQQMGDNEFIPLTSRTIEQYERIRFFKDDRKPDFALVDNGGILLVNGEVDEEWRKMTHDMILKDISTMREMVNEIRKYGTVKWQDDMIIFLKLLREEDYGMIEKIVEKYRLMIFRHFTKVYICSKKLSKGNAVRRFMTTYIPKIQKYYTDDFIIVAGDTKVDLSMMESADLCVFSKELQDGYHFLKGQYLEKREVKKQKTEDEKVENQKAKNEKTENQKTENQKTENQKASIRKIENQRVIFTESVNIGKIVFELSNQIFKQEG